MLHIRKSTQPCFCLIHYFLFKNFHKILKINQENCEIFSPDDLNQFQFSPSILYYYIKTTVLLYQNYYVIKSIIKYNKRFDFLLLLY